MGFAANKARVRSNIAKGGYQAPDNTLAEGIMTASSIIAQGIIDKGKERRAEEKRKAAAAAKLAKEQKEKEQKAKDRARKAKALAVELGADPSNSEAVAYLTEQLFFFDDDTKAVYDKADSDKKIGKIDFVQKEEPRLLQGPDVPADFKVGIDTGGDKPITEFKSGVPITVGDLPKIAGNENNGEAVRTEAGQMAEIFAPVSEEPAMMTPFEGLKIDPNAEEFDEIDFGAIQSVTDVDGALRNIGINDLNVSPKAVQELKNMRATFFARESQAWLSEAAKGKEEAYAAMMTFEAQNDNENYVIAKGIYTGWLNQEKPFEGLLDPEGLIGKSAQDLRSTKEVAIALGAKTTDLSTLEQLLESTELVESDAKAQEYITNSSSYNRTVAQIEAALVSGNYKADDPLISHLNNIARKQQKQEIEKEVGVQGAVAVDGLYIDPETKEKTFAVIMRYPDGSSKLRDGKVVDYIPLSDTEASEFAKLSVQTQKYAQELVTSSTAIAEGLRNAENIIQIAKDDPRVRNAGGDVAQFISGFARGTDSVLGVVQDMFEGKGADYVLTEDQLRRELGARGISENVLTAALSDELLNLADKTAQFEAGVLALVFRSGRMEGQAGNAMSNKDFERLMQMLDVKGSVTAFENTVRNYMKEKILSYDDKAFGQDAAGAVAAFKKNFGWSPVQEALPFEDFVTQRNESTLTQSFNATMQYSPQATKTGDDETVGVTPTAMNAFLESGGGIKIGDAELKLTDVLGELKKYETQFQGEELVAKQQALITQIAKAAGITDEKAIANFAKIIGTKVLPTTK